MPINRRDERLDNLNIKDKYDKGDEVYPLKPGMLGWISAPEDQREMQYRFYNADLLGLEEPAYGLDKMLPWPATVDGMSVVAAYEQTGGTCVGFSGMQACTGRHMLRDNTPKRFDAYGYYCQVRIKMGDLRCNQNAGATLPAAGSVLLNWGAAQIIGGKIQGNNPANGIDKYVWGFNADSIRTAIANGIVPIIGISVYQHMLSPKLIGSNYWMYWSDGSWGGFLGGHAMAILGWSDTLKLFPASKGSMWLPNSWGSSWCNGKGAWMSWEAFDRLLKSAQPAEIRLDTDRTTGPVGKLELVSFSIVPAAPGLEKITATFAVKNTGLGALTGVKLAIEDRVTVNGVNTYYNGFGFEGPFDLAPGATHSYTAERPDALTEGLWRFRADRLDPTPVVLSSITVDVTGGTPPPPPPPPPPVDALTMDFNDFAIDGVKYTSKVQQPAGVKMTKV